MSIAYDGDPPGFVGVHYGGDGIGFLGSLLPLNGTDGESIIKDAVTVDAASEYRLVVASIPTGVVVNENGSGTSSRETVLTCTLFKDGVEQ